MNTNNIHVTKYNGTQRGINYVFVLSTTKNAGKPSYQPIPNSFAIYCKSIEHAQVVFSVFYALYSAKIARFQLRNASMKFETFDDFRKIFSVTLELVSSDEVVSAIKKIALIRYNQTPGQKRNTEGDQLLIKYAEELFKAFFKPIPAPDEQPETTF